MNWGQINRSRLYFWMLEPAQKQLHGNKTWRWLQDPKWMMHLLESDVYKKGNLNFGIWATVIGHESQVEDDAIYIFFLFHTSAFKITFTSRALAAAFKLLLTVCCLTISFTQPDTSGGQKTCL